MIPRSRSLPAAAGRATAASALRRASAAWLLALASLCGCRSTQAALGAGTQALERISEHYPAASALSIDGRLERADSSTPLRLETASRGRFRFELGNGELLVFDGDTLWSRSPGEPVLPVAFGRRERSLARIWLLSGQAFEPGLEQLDALAWGGDSHSLELRFEPGEWRALVVTTPDSRPQSWQSGARDALETGSFDDWRPVESGEFPHLVRLARGEQEQLEFRVEQVRGTPVEEPARFARPAELELASRWSAGLPARVPIQVTQSGHLLVRVELAAREGAGALIGEFVLDSGAGLTCIQQSLARQLGLQTSGRSELNALSGKLSAQTCEGPAIRVGPLELPPAQWWMPELDTLEQAIGRPIAGILGFPLFAHAQVEIDARAGWIELRPGGRAAPQGAAPLRLDGRSAFVAAQLDGASMWLRLDTGSADGLTLHAETVERLDLLDGDPATRLVRLSGLDGQRLARRTRVFRFRLAGRGMRTLEATLLGRGSGALDASRTDGNLGMQLLGRAPFVVDYRGGWLAWSRPGAGDAPGVEEWQAAPEAWPPARE